MLYVVQPTQEGFGHAGFHAAEAIGDEPFLLMLGDHIYKSVYTKSFATQLIEAYNQY